MAGPGVFPWEEWKRKRGITEGILTPMQTPIGKFANYITGGLMESAGRGFAPPTVAAPATPVRTQFGGGPVGPPDPNAGQAAAAPAPVPSYLDQIDLEKLKGPMRTTTGGGTRLSKRARAALGDWEGKTGVAALGAEHQAVLSGKQESKIIGGYQTAKQKLDEQYRKSMAGISSEYKAEVAAYKEMVKKGPGKIDTGRWWRSKDMGGKIATVLAGIAGGFVEGFTDGRIKNKAIGIVERAIDRDIKAQVHDLQSKSRQQAGQANLVGMLRGQLGNERAELTFAKAMLYEDVQIHLQKHAAKQKGELARVRTLFLSAQVAEKKAKILSAERSTWNSVRLSPAMQEAQRAKILMGMEGQRARTLGAESRGKLAQAKLSQAQEKAKAPTPQIRKRLRMARGLATDYERFWRMYKKEGGLAEGQPFFAAFKGGQAAYLKNLAKGMGVMQAVLIQGSKPAVQEQEIYAGWYPGEWDLRSVAAQKMRDQLQRSLDGVQSIRDDLQMRGKDTRQADQTFEILQRVKSRAGL